MYIKLFIIMSRTVSEKREILSRLEPTVVHENVVSSRLLERLNHAFHNSEKNYKNTGPVTVDFWPERTDVLPGWWFDVDQLITQYIGPHGTFAGNFYEVRKPHILHNDDNKRLWPRLHKTVVIPLDIIEPTQFGIFDQCYLNGPVKIRRPGHQSPSVYYNQDLTDNSLLKYNTGKEFCRDTHDKYFSHQHYDAFHGLSVESIVTWKPGDIIVFDTARIHCGTNFNRQGISQKLGLSVFTYLK
jgi:hypothetical protein